jgi:hypothetical protein
VEEEVFATPQIQDTMLDLAGWPVLEEVWDLAGVSGVDSAEEWVEGFAGGSGISQHIIQLMHRPLKRN